MDYLATKAIENKLSRWNDELSCDSDTNKESDRFEMTSLFWAAEECMSSRKRSASSVFPVIDWSNIENEEEEENEKPELSSYGRKWLSNKRRLHLKDRTSKRPSSGGIPRVASHHCLLSLAMDNGGDTVGFERKDSVGSESNSSWLEAC